MRMIDADALDKVKFHPLPYTHITPSDADAESYKRGWNDAIDAIMSEAPTIEERKKGKWEKREVSRVKAIDEWQSARCSVCGKYHTTPYMYYFVNYNYCPNCGARMGDVNHELV